MNARDVIEAMLGTHRVSDAEKDALRQALEALPAGWTGVEPERPSATVEP